MKKIGGETGKFEKFNGKTRWRNWKIWKEKTGGNLRIIKLSWKNLLPKFEILKNVMEKLGSKIWMKQVENLKNMVAKWEKKGKNNRRIWKMVMLY